MTKPFMVISIRSMAENMVGDCTDYQIIFCAAAVGKIQKLEQTIDELSASDLSSLYQWIVLEERFNFYA